MKITADTNVLLRAYVADDEGQAAVAVDLLAKADIVAVSSQALCEFAWVLGRQYQTTRDDIAAAIRALLDTTNVVVNRPAVEAGLMILEAGGDFADGVIAFDGGWLGGETFVSFDRKAVKLISARGASAQLLS
ncbi:type II toxin-antitoxin system VapC family toxin [Mesorhizobium sp. B3-2-1]|uniref:type II toxin-antitoxin system VapC family toxin n=1 Tax=Mesorhizobium sp. B3-2-1 TaxID=2589891 RepID=UPI00112E009C|nr:type II toxin-antitoxin system VapC family toxin [Mesorhizobium sp. B3-2-1]TPI28263.1 type II toxin-antitoxin system VapC family toxin [Mesorhizobium sp. B3-2-1]